jgi:hypothetical protein
LLKDPKRTGRNSDEAGFVRDLNRLKAVIFCKLGLAAASGIAVGSTRDEEDGRRFVADGNKFPFVAKASSWRRWESKFNVTFAGKTVAVADRDEIGAPCPRAFQWAHSTRSQSLPNASQYDQPAAKDVGTHVAAWRLVSIIWSESDPNPTS